MTITNKKSIFKKGTFAITTSEIKHENIQNIQIYQTMTNRIFGVGKLSISSSGQSDFEIEIKGITDFEKVKLIIEEQQEVLN